MLDLGSEGDNMRSLIRNLFLVGLIASFSQEGMEVGIGKVCGQTKHVVGKQCDQSKNLNSLDSSSLSKKMGRNLREALIKPKYSHPSETVPVSSQKEQTGNNLLGESQ